MVDDLRTQSVAVEHCPWCSAEIAPALASCPACGATLMGDSDASLPGVTALDQEAITRAARVATTQRRSRLLSWISGDYDEGPEQPAPPGSLSLPPIEVRREMLRLELEAEMASLRAQNEAAVAEAEAQARDVAPPAPVEAAATAAPSAEPADAPTGAGDLAAGDAGDRGDRPD